MRNNQYWGKVHFLYFHHLQKFGKSNWFFGLFTNSFSTTNNVQNFTNTFDTIRGCSKSILDTFQEVGISILKSYAFRSIVSFSDIFLLLTWQSSTALTMSSTQCKHSSFSSGSYYNASRYFKRLKVCRGLRMINFLLKWH